MDGGKCAESMVTLWLAHKGQMDFLLSSDYLITVNMRDGKKGPILFSVRFLSNMLL